MQQTEARVNGILEIVDHLKHEVGQILHKNDVRKHQMQKVHVTCTTINH